MADRTPLTISWDELLRRIAKGEPVEDVLDEKHALDRENFRAYLAELGPRGQAALENYDRNMRDVDSGVMGARGTWHALSPPQRETLREVSLHGGRIERQGKVYRTKSQTGRRIGLATVRNLCSRDLLAWDGGAFDPEAAAVLTERGIFVLKHGEAGA